MRLHLHDGKISSTVDDGGFPGGSKVKNLPANEGDMDSVSGLGRFPGEGNSNPLQHSCLENPMDRGAWQATIHGLQKNWTQFSD